MMQRRMAMMSAVAGFSLLWGLASAQTPVDLELSLVVDSSGSINDPEFSLQQDGLESAFRDSTIQTGIETLPNGLASNLIFFSSSAVESLPFRSISTAGDANTFADDIAALDRPTGIGTLTDMEEAINLAASTLQANTFDGPSTIDVSGDGIETLGDASVARDAAAAAGIDINALAVGGGALPQFFEDNVISGTDSFVVEAEDFEDFQEAIEDKLSIEITGMPTPSPS